MDVTTIQWLDYTGVIVFAIAGVFAAAERKMDAFGALVIAYVTCLGGGTIRDVLINKYPIFWMQELTYLWLILATSLITFFLIRDVKKILPYLMIPDAVGLGIYTLIGLQKAAAMGFPPEICVIMGVITAVGGGMIRDILCNQPPLIFHNQEIYATACLIGAGLYFLLLRFDWNNQVISIITVLTIFTIRMVSIRMNVKMPRVTTDKGLKRR
ncbi:MAG: trimeric intracellular cation channel family protein [Bacteroidetes bacterium]|nr:trimeric intracellular cation channel family protein [Bacteroidota bacterium]